jgi:predicted dienelactone hydrolase
MRHRRILMQALLLLLLPLAAEAIPFAVGHRSIVFVDPARGNRQVQTEVYYPADQSGDDVPVAAGVFPVITFGHGYLMVWSAYQYLWTFLVPRGTIFALPRTEGGLVPNHEQFGRDLAFLVDELRIEGADPSSPFYGHVTGASCVMGHSMGGGASVLAASYNSSITALANLAAAETNPSAIEAARSVTAPCLVLAGSDDCVAPPSQHQIPIYEALASSCKTLLTVTGGTHCQFADYNFNCQLGEYCSGSISREQQHELVETFLTPWLDWTLRGDVHALADFQDLLATAQGLTVRQDCPIASVTAESAARIQIELRVLPNPFSRDARIRFHLSSPAAVRLEIFTAAGRMVRVPLDAVLGAGFHEIPWEGNDAAGRALPAGLYFCRLRTPEAGAERTMTLLR